MYRLYRLVFVLIRVCVCDFRVALMRALDLVIAP